MSDNVVELSKMQVLEVVRQAQEAWKSNNGDKEARVWVRANRVDARSNQLKASSIDRVIPKHVIEKVARDEYDETSNAYSALSWLCTSKPFLFLLGSVGAGKTVAAAIALAERPGFYLSAPEAESVFAAKFGPLVEKQGFILERRMLVIDDVGKERDQRGFGATLERIVDSRQGRHYKTMFTSNLSKKQIFERYPDDRLISRLRAGALFITNVGDDMRNKQEERNDR